MTAKGKKCPMRPTKIHKPRARERVVARLSISKKKRGRGRGRKGLAAGKRGADQLEAEGGRSRA